MKEKVIVTGGTGFIGANLIRRLLCRGSEVHLLVSSEYSSWRIRDVIRDIAVHEVELTDLAGLSRIVGEILPDWVFHLAAWGNSSTHNDISRIVQTNIVGTVNLVHACLSSGFKAFVNAGSSSEYGFKDHPPHETEWLEPNSCYAVAKASATLFCRFIARSTKNHITTLRLYSVYGPYEDPVRFIPALLVHGLNGILPPLVHPNVARDFVYIDDVCDAFLLAAQKEGESGAVYNLGTGVQTTIQSAVDSVRRLQHIVSEPEWGSMTNREWDTSVWVSDNRKIGSDLCWKPKYGFEEGLRSMFEWFRENPLRIQFYEQHYPALRNCRPTGQMQVCSQVKLNIP